MFTMVGSVDGQETKVQNTYQQQKGFNVTLSQRNTRVIKQQTRTLSSSNATTLYINNFQHLRLWLGNLVSRSKDICQRHTECSKQSDAKSCRRIQNNINQ